MPSITNGKSTSLQIGRPPLKPVTQPVLTIVMSGVMRVQLPASPHVQAQFLLLAPNMREQPDKFDYVCKDAEAAAPHAIKIIQDMLQRSPGLQAPNGDVGLSYALLDGKLNYVFQLCVHTK